MNDLKAYLESMGGLHDSVVTAIVWRPATKEIRFTFVNLYSNFLGLAEYPGLTPGELAFREVSDLACTMGKSEQQLNVDDFCATAPTGGRVSVAITFWPVGRISFDCLSACDIYTAT
jgi:hypothetical protein